MVEYKRYLYICLNLQLFFDLICMIDAYTFILYYLCIFKLKTNLVEKMYNYYLKIMHLIESFPDY